MISFWIADPPAVSYFSVHCLGSKSKAVEFVLLRAIFDSGHGEFEYLMYRAGGGGASLDYELLITSEGQRWSTK
ncbi:hypothetical protein C2845_PM01G04640 [Panicum miliaceum]|uniref:Uncharacterized protein n=1 Tax=Panicum miliaceum TaxID=4540 RepID=A0A3L6TSU9_PANMI|nr:hypothetical protein C2845_PM01G04640 [Panicum miliaceum]